MYRFREMKFVALLIAVMMSFGLISFAAPQMAAAASPSFSSLQGLSSVSLWLAQDTAGLSQVKSDLTALQGLTPSTGLEDQLFGSSGLLPLSSTSKVTEAEATKFLLDLETIKYSPDVSTAIANAGNFYLNDASTEGNLLPGVTVVDFLNFATDVQTTGLAGALSSNYQTVMQSSQSSPLPASLISTALTSAMSSSADAAMTSAVSKNGWTFANIAAAEMLIDQQVDPTYLGDTALFQAYVHSNTPITSGSAPVDITVPSGGSGSGGSGSIDLSSLLTGDTTGSLPQITITSTTSTVKFQQGTTITASGGTWDGIITLPTIVTPTASELPSNVNASSVVAVSLGSDNGVELTFSQPVSIYIPGQTGKSVGYFESGGSFVPITNKLASDVLPAGQADGYYDDGINITIWTNHFTTFVAYTETVISSGVGSSGGGSVTVYTPVVQTEAATVVSSTSITLNGDITSDSGYTVTDYGFMWGTSASTLTNKLDVGTNNQSGAFTDTLSITPGTTYYFEAYATNSSGTADGAVMSFTAGVPTTTTPSTGTVFSDVPASFWGYNAISRLSSEGIVAGYPDGTFKPNAAITRAEFTTMLVKALGLNAGGTTGQFTDVTADAWYYGSVNAAVYAGLVSGMGDNLFAPEALITREQMAVMVAKALGNKAPATDGTELNAFSDRTHVSSWAVTGMEEVIKAGIVVGMSADSLVPLAHATRAQAAAMLYNALAFLGK